MQEVGFTSQRKTIEYPGSRLGGWVPETEAERNAVREQLERILANPLFRNSKRYAGFLRFVVQHTIDADPTQLKERTLGVEVFGRDPDYDTTLDPVVRTTAGELRKRIAQYYYEAGHETEIRFDLPSGSYVPEFRLPPIRQAPEITEKAIPIPIAPPQAGWQHRYLPWFLTAVMAIALAASILWPRLGTSTSALDKFWSPLRESPNPILLCIGGPGVEHFPGPGGQNSQGLSIHEIQLSEHVALADATTLARLAGILQSKGKLYHVREEHSATLTDLREGPVVLVGGFNNEWTLRLMEPLRFSFERTLDTIRIKDRQNPSRHDFEVNVAKPYLKLTGDYALIARVVDPTTQQIVVVAAGLTKYGTVAAGEFLSDPAYMEEAAGRAAGNWAQKNLEIVISTKVIDGNSGPPHVVAVHSW